LFDKDEIKTVIKKETINDINVFNNTIYENAKHFNSPIHDDNKNKESINDINNNKINNDNAEISDLFIHNYNDKIKKFHLFSNNYNDKIRKFHFNKSIKSEVTSNNTSDLKSDTNLLIKKDLIHN
jgi:hypothetical protein